MSKAGVTTDAVDITGGPVIAALHRETRRPVDDVWESSSVTEVLAMPGVAAWVCSVAGHPAGFIIVRTAADESEILMIGVLPGHRRTGIGQGLVHTALDGAGARGARRVYLEVAEDNEPAREFYAILGFSEVGRRRGYYRRGGGAVDALVLARNVEE